MKKLWSVLTILSCFYAVPALSEQINCPLETVHSNITDSVPSPWWSTPQQGNLVSTEVIMMGGQPTLMCKYWAYDKTVTIQRRAPENTKNCVATGKSFNCN